MKQFRIGITGGIGAGKTVICKLIEKIGYPVYYSDSRARYLMEYHPIVSRKVVELFGSLAFKGGELNRAFIAQSIFQDDGGTLREALNEIVHKYVREDFDNWCSEQDEKYELVFQESAILLETGAHKLFDATVYVSAPQEVRVQRVVARDGMSEDAIYARIATQFSHEESVELADFELRNDGSPYLIHEVHGVLSKVKNKLGLKG